MRRVKILSIFSAVLFSETVMCSQNISSILEFMGTDNVEEISPYEMERLEDMMGRPLDLNYASESRLKDSGLFSPYQIASLLDYRARHGDLLSMGELAAVDGFGRDFVSKLSPFISLESRRIPGTPAQSSVYNDLAVRASCKTGTNYGYGLKYRISVGESFTGGMALSRTSGAKKAGPDAFSGHLAYHFRRRPGKVIIGDFNARFGQGLALWNGMSFSGLTSASSFMRKSSSISASSSFTGNYSFRGLAADVGFGRFRMAAMAAAANLKDGFSVLPAMNLSYFMKTGQISLTHYADFLSDGRSAVIPDMKTAADFAFCFDGVDVFAETSFDWVSSAVAALAGTAVPLNDDVRLAVMLRYYPSTYSSSKSAAARSTTGCSNEHAASVAADFKAGKASVDFAYFPVPKDENASIKSMQAKAHAEWAWMISDSFRTKIRLSERFRTWGQPFRTDIRTDFSYLSEFIAVNLRLNTLFCMGTGFLGYLEGGYTGMKLSSFIRTGLFFIDNWNDRIYAYERDAPGSFNVPAYYGRGFWTAFTMNWKFTRWGRVYLRAAFTSYPFMKEKKPGRAELKIQFAFRL